jgi:hypothetical protein
MYENMMKGPRPSDFKIENQFCKIVRIESKTVIKPESHFV